MTSTLEINLAPGCLFGDELIIDNSGRQLTTIRKPVEGLGCSKIVYNLRNNGVRELVSSMAGVEPLDIKEARKIYQSFGRNFQ